MIPLKDQELIRQKFAHELVGPVKIDFFTERDVGLTVPGKRPCEYCKPTREMLQELAGLSDAVSLRVHYVDEAKEEAASYGIERVPGIVLRGLDGFYLKYYGIPAGTEFPAFLESITDVSRGEVLLSEESLEAVHGIDHGMIVRVFVTPTCPYCPAMARAAFQLTMANPKIKSEVIEINEFPDLAERYNVRGVPLTVIDDRLAIPGMVHESVLVEQLVKAAESRVLPAEQVAGPSNPVEPLKDAAKAERGKERPSGLFIP